MIVDAILDLQTSKSATLDNLKYMYDEAMNFEFHDLARAIDCGDDDDIKNALHTYIDDNDYNPAIHKIINSIVWA